MPRPRNCRRVEGTPSVTYFKPRGVPLRELAETYLSVEGFEALRLADLEGLAMEAAAASMQVSRHTFGRILTEARRAVAEALVQGQALRIEGGHYRVDDSNGQSRPVERAKHKELSMTKVAVSSEGPTLQDQVDPRFGRSGGFVVVDIETMESVYVDNGASQAMAHGAGIGAAQRVAGAGAGVLLTGYVGPKAFEALKAAGVKVGQDLEGMTVLEALNRYKAGQVPFASQSNK